MTLFFLLWLFFSGFLDRNAPNLWLFFSSFWLEKLSISSDTADGNVWLTVIVFQFTDVAFSLFMVDGNALFVLQLFYKFYYCSCNIGVIKNVTVNVESMTFWSNFFYLILKS